MIYYYRKVPFILLLPKAREGLIWAVWYFGSPSSTFGVTAVSVAVAVANLPSQTTIANNVYPLFQLFLISVSCT